MPVPAPLPGSARPRRGRRSPPEWWREQGRSSARPRWRPARGRPSEPWPEGRRRGRLATGRRLRGRDGGGSAATGQQDRRRDQTTATTATTATSSFSSERGRRRWPGTAGPGDPIARRSGPMYPGDRTSRGVVELVAEREMSASSSPGRPPSRSLPAGDRPTPATGRPRPTSVDWVTAAGTTRSRSALNPCRVDRQIGAEAEVPGAQRRAGPGLSDRAGDGSWPRAGRTSLSAGARTWRVRRRAGRRRPPWPPPVGRRCWTRPVGPDRPIGAGRLRTARGAPRPGGGPARVAGRDAGSGTLPAGGPMSRPRRHATPGRRERARHGQGHQPR